MAHLLYKYAPLPSQRHIRLMVLEPIADTTTLVAHLHVHNLDKIVDFVALSYAWGVSQQMKALKLDGLSFFISGSLYAGLERLAQKGLQISIWVDAICINQNDIQEKAHQVPLMSDIYSGASSVLAWLGEASAAESEALTLLPTVLEHLETIDLSAQLDAQQISMSFALPLQPSELWTAYARIITRPWFNRLWVLQEMLLAVEFTILCGAAQVSWEDIERFERQILRHNLHTIIAGSEFTSPQIFKALNIIANFSTCKAKMSASSDKSVPITILLHVARRKDVTIPIDRVYGMLSLVPRSVQAGVSVDYSLGPALVFSNFIRLCLREDPMLELFSQVCGQDPGRMQGLPSWCTELDQQPPINRFGGTNGLASGYHAGFAGPFRASKLVKEVSDSAVLMLRGFLIDVVAEKIDGLRIPFQSRLDRPTAASFLVWEEKVSALAERYSTCPERWREDYACTLLADRTLTMDNMYHEAGSNCLDLYTRYFQQLRDYADSGKARRSIVGYPAVDAIADRAVVATSHGMIGYARPSVEPGDVVCVFQNSIVPFIVRLDTLGKPGKLIGEAYIRGLMRGEALDMEKRGEVQLVDIRLA